MHSYRIVREINQNKVEVANSQRIEDGSWSDKNLEQSGEGGAFIPRPSSQVRLSRTQP